MGSIDFFHFLFYLTIIIAAILLMRLMIKATQYLDIAIAEKERNSMPIDTYENEIERLKKRGAERLKKRNKNIFATLLIVSMIFILQAVYFNWHAPGSSATTVLFTEVTQEEAMEILGKLSDMRIRAFYSGGNIYIPLYQEQRLRERLTVRSVLEKNHEAEENIKSREIVYFENFPGVENIIHYLELEEDNVMLLYKTDYRFIFCFFADPVDVHDRAIVSYASYIRNAIGSGFEWTLYDGTISSTHILKKGGYRIQITTISDIEAYREAVHEAFKSNQLFDEQKIVYIDKIRDENILFDVAFISEE